MTSRVGGVALGLALLLLGGCRSQESGVPRVQRLPECEEPTPSTRSVEPNVLPPETTISRVEEVGNLRQVVGFVLMTPLEARADYERRTDLRLLDIEDEGFEMEAEVATPGHRAYIEVVHICKTGSRVEVVIAPEEEAHRVPKPRGGD